MVPLFLSLILFTQAAAPPQEPNGVRSSENAASLTIPIAVAIEGVDRLPENAGEPVPTIRLVPSNDGTAIETALSSKDISLILGREYQVQVENLPQGYTVKSMTFGLKDLKKDKLTTMDLFTGPPRILTYTGRGELQAVVDSIMFRQSRVLSITIAPPQSN